MRCTRSSRLRTMRRQRSGSILVWCGLLLPALIAMVGLVIDGGLMLAAYREGQNAADAAALAAATDLMYGKGTAQATAIANTYVTDAAYNNLPNATVAINIPPSRGGYAGAARYVEAIVTYPIATHFLHVIPGFNRNQSVTARAVAGFEPTSIDEGVMALAHDGTGLSAVGNATLRVQGRILINSESLAAAVPGKLGIWASDVEVVGNVKNPDDFKNIDGGSGNVLHPGAAPSPDLFGHLPTPTAANGVGGPQTIPSDGQFQPGVYTQNITIEGGTVTFAPGIYVLKGVGLTIRGNATVTGHGVMFYLTGNDYTTAGSPDSADPVDPLNLSFPTNSGTTFGGVNLEGTGTVTLSPIADANSPFDGMLFYFRRANTSDMKITGNADRNRLTGTIYDKYGTLTLAGQGTYNAQFTVGRMVLAGNGDVTVNYSGQNLGKAPQVYLVE